MVNKLHNFHQKRSGYLVFAVIELAVAYGFASLAIDRGNLWWYILTLTFLIGGLQNIVHLIGKIIHGNKTAKA